MRKGGFVRSGGRSQCLNVEMMVCDQSILEVKRVLDWGVGIGVFPWLLLWLWDELRMVRVFFWFFVAFPL